MFNFSSLPLYLICIRLPDGVGVLCTQYSPTKKAVPERTLRFGTATDFAIENAAVEGSYSKPSYVFTPRV